MKSIMEEASSILEAIQKGWERAGKPQEFSVKVFEDAETSFFGMRTVKSAKIALFYKEGGPSLTTEKPDSSNRPPRNSHQSDRSLNQARDRQSHGRPVDDRRERRDDRSRDDRSRRTDHSEAPRRTEEKPFDRAQDRQDGQGRRERPVEQIRQPRAAAPLKTSRFAQATQEARDPQTEPRGGVWNDEMTEWVNNWIKQSLGYIGRSNITFSTESSRNLLRIDFDDTITGDERKERMLFSSFAHLIMSSLRNKFKGDLKHLKVVLNSK